MAASIIDGKALAKKLNSEVKERVAELGRQGVTPALTVVLVGEDPASKSYVRSKERACKRAGVKSKTVRLPVDTTEEVLLGLLAQLNQAPDVHGILVQLPLPVHIDPGRVVTVMDPIKDVDAFHPENLGLLMRDAPRFVPCTPAGVLHILRSLSVPLAGKRAVIIGRSLIVGKPLAYLLLSENMTVTVCHSRTRDLPAIIAQGELVVAAVGRPGLIKGDWIRPGAIVVDVGTNPLPGGGFVGDVEFEVALKRASWITPVPGGVGPLTVARLLHNVCVAAHLRAERARSR